MTVIEVPPQNLDAEEYVLGSVLISPSALDVCADILRADDFYRIGHGRIFAAAASLAARDLPHDSIAVADELDKRGHLQDAGGRVRLHELSSIVPATANASHWARIVRDEAIKRDVQKVGLRLAALDLDMPEAADMLAAAEQQVYELARKRETRSARAFSDVVRDAVDEIKQLAEHGRDLLGLPTSLADLDRALRGLRPGALYVVAATTGQGKSALATGVAGNLLVSETPTPVAFFSLEMGETEIANRMISRLSRVSHDDLTLGRLDGEQWGRVLDAAARLERVPLHLESNPTLTPAQLRSKLRRLDNVGLVVVDYLQLLTPDKQSDSRTRDVAEIARMLKQTAMALNVPVLALAQLNRNVDSRPGGRPQLADLKESGEIEQAADVVVFIWKSHEPADGVRELLVAKNRHGARDVAVRVAWRGDLMRFSDLARLPGTGVTAEAA